MSDPIRDAAQGIPVDSQETTDVMSFSPLSVSDAEAPYLARSCAACAALAVPLLSEGELLGARVLLRTRGEPAFRDDDHSHARILGDLAAVSLRRVLLLEEAERTRRAADEERETLLHQEQRVREKAERANRLIQDLLDVARMEAGNLSMDRSPPTGGRIWVESRVGSGSAFRFTLPAAG